MTDEDVRALAGEILDVEHDILPAQEKAAEFLAALRVPPPKPEPPTWMKWLFWTSVLRLPTRFRDWAFWEKGHSRTYGTARFASRIVLVGAVVGTTLALSTHHERQWLLGYSMMYLAVEVVSGLRTLDRRGGKRRPLVARDGQSSTALKIENAARVAGTLLVCALAVVLPHLLD